MTLAWEHLARQAMHPTRVRILEVLVAKAPEPASPSDMARELDGTTLGQVSYHVRALVTAGLLELVSTAPRRGALEHFYRVAPEVTP